MQLRIIVPGAPRGKERPRFNRSTGRAFTPERTARYENLVALAAQDAMAGRRLFEGPLILRVTAYLVIPQSWSEKKRFNALIGVTMPTSKPDHDNVAKMTDALNNVVWIDDSQVVETYIRKLYSATPRLELEISNYFGDHND